MNILKKFLPKKVKSKTLSALAIIISLMIAVPVAIMHHAKIKAVHAESRLLVHTLATQANRLLIDTNANQLRLLANTIADIPDVKRFFCRARPGRPARPDHAHL